VDPDDDPDASVFSMALETTKDKFTHMDLRDYESKHQPFFLTYKVFGSRSSHPLAWLSAQPPTKGPEKDRATESGRGSSKATQQAESKSRHHDASVSNAQQNADLMEVAAKMHTSSVSSCPTIPTDHSHTCTFHLWSHTYAYHIICTCIPYAYAVSHSQAMALKLEISKAEKLHALLNTDASRDALVSVLQKTLPSVSDCLKEIKDA
jgi:hypothetical protein